MDSRNGFIRERRESRGWIEFRLIRFQSREFVMRLRAQNRQVITSVSDAIFDQATSPCRICKNRASNA